MSLVRILRLRRTSTLDWAQVGAALDARLADVQLASIDDTHGVLVVTAADATALARVDADAITPWLAEVGLAREGKAIEATLVERIADTSEPTDAQRVARFVAGVRASGAVWGLRKKTWARSPAGHGREALPLWPDEDSATRCIEGDWSRYRARPIALDGFLAEWLPGMVEDGIVAVVLPTPDHPGAIVAPEALLAALRDD